MHLVGGEGAGLVDVGHLEVSHAEVGQEHEQGARGERHGKAARLLGAGELGGHDGERGEDHAPCAHADGVPKVVPPRLAALVFRLLRGEAAVVHRVDEARPPGVRHAGERAGLAHAGRGGGAARRGVACRGGGWAAGAEQRHAVAGIVAGVEVADLAAEVVERMDGHGTFQSIGMDASIVPLRAGGRRWGEWRWGGRSAHGGAVPPTRCDGRPSVRAICFQRVSQADGVPAPAPASGTMFRRAAPRAPRRVIGYSTSDVVRSRFVHR